MRAFGESLFRKKLRKKLSICFVLNRALNFTAINSLQITLCVVGEGLAPPVFKAFDSSFAVKDL